MKIEIDEKELFELECMAEIGMATIKAFENEYTMDLTTEDDFNDSVTFVNVLFGVDELLERAAQND